MKTIYKSLMPVFILIMAFTATAQIPIVTVNVTTVPAASTATYTAPGANGSSLSGNTYNYTFGAATQTSYNLKDLNNFTIGSDVYSYSYSANSVVKIRRADNPVASGNRSLLWLESINTGDASRIAIVNPYKESMENIFDDNTFNAGTDNIFGNQGDGNGNNNNIERLDVIFTKGIIPTQKNKCGFAVFERGDDNAHDPFVIAAITAIDAAGNPTQYGPLIRINTPHWGNIPSSTTSYQIVRRDPATESNLRVSTSGTQNIGGVYVSMNDLSIADGTKVYGYSLFPLDVPMGAADADLVDYNDPVFFPRNTAAVTSQGGLDLLAITGLFATPNSVLIPPTAYDITMPPIVQASPILPFIATAVNTTITSYTVETIPPASQGILNINMNGVLMPVSAGMMLTPDLINSMSFTPDSAFTDNVVFTYSATDANSLLSNIATYTIPVIGRQATILVVNLLNFTGTIDDNKTLLLWQTSQENNGSYFELQKSTDGNNFETFATITAKGNSSNNSYEYTDDLLFYSSKTIYYRLKIVHTNSNYKYSPVLTIKKDIQINNDIKAWPLPFTNNLNVAYSSQANEPIKISITSINGAHVFTSGTIAKKGMNSISINQAQSIPPGTYLLTISNSTKTQTIKVIKN